jgi:hypothetical protein
MVVGDSILGEVVLTLAGEGMAAVAGTMAAAGTMVVAVVTLVVVAVTTAPAEGAVTMAMVVVGMVPVAVAMVVIALNMCREVGSVMGLDGAMLDLAEAVVTRVMALVALAEITSLYRGNQVDRQVLLLMAIGTTLVTEGISKGGAQGGVALWAIGIGDRTRRVLLEEALMPSSCNKLSRRWWRL